MVFFLKTILCALEPKYTMKTELGIKRNKAFVALLGRLWLSENCESLPTVTPNVFWNSSWNRKLRREEERYEEEREKVILFYFLLFILLFERYFKIKLQWGFMQLFWSFFNFILLNGFTMTCGICFKVNRKEGHKVRLYVEQDRLRVKFRSWAISTWTYISSHSYRFEISTIKYLK